MSLRYALIGCGKISQNHMAAALKNSLEIVAVCDVEEGQMNTIMEKFHLRDVKKYVDYKEMIEKENIELISICTKSGKHGQIALDCIDRGVNLIIEKPIALSLDEADKIIKKSQEKNIKVSACHQNRFNKSILKIREAIEKERFGKLLHGAAHIRWNRGENYYKQAPWRGTWEEDGGTLMNQCIHNIDLLRWIMGDEIIEVVGMTDNLMHDFIDAEDLGIALIKFANGSYGIIEGTINVFPENLEETLYIFGEKGTVKAGGKSVKQIEEWRFADNLDNPEEIKDQYGQNSQGPYNFSLNLLYADVIDSIISDRQPYITAEDGRKALELVLAIYKSAAEGKSVKLPLDKCSTTDFKGRFRK